MANVKRLNQRHFDAIRKCTILSESYGYAEGSVLIAMGNTKVLCNVSIIDSVPRFLKDKGTGWLTAEYAMLPRATHTRSDRESAKGKQQSRSIEIQRLIGRALRQSIDLKALGERTIQVDCDVLQADGGTRVAAINGAMVAIILALRKLQYEKTLNADPFKNLITAISLGRKDGQILLDLDYEEDSSMDVDLNLIVNEKDEIIEIQGTAEHAPLPLEQMVKMVELGLHGIHEIRSIQKNILDMA